MTPRETNRSNSNLPRLPIAGLAALGLAFGLLISTTVEAQNAYKARLAPAPFIGVSAANMPSTVGGLGSATASLSGRKLTVSGTFEKMASPATTATLGLGLAAGARGDVIYNLTVTKAPQSDPAGTSGMLSGTFDITPAQVEALQKGKLYVLINSDKAPKGHLLGWLLK